MLTYLHIRAISNACSKATMQVGHAAYPCVIGRSGKTHLKREGDGKSPIGFWRVCTGYFRADRVRRRAGNQVACAMRKTDGWCDDPASGQYNRRVVLPCDFSHEGMWREDAAYDVVFPTDHNQRPRVRGGGSAIFLHLTRPGVGHTAGCVAISAVAMRKLLVRSKGNFCLVIWPSQGRLSGVRQKLRCQP